MVCDSLRHVSNRQFCAERKCASLRSWTVPDDKKRSDGNKKLDRY